MKHIYIFDETLSNAAVFGVGTYVKLLLNILNDIPLRITVVKLYSTSEELIIEYVNNIRYIFIPSLTPEYASRIHYYSSVSFILLPFISLNDTNIFHHNYFICGELFVILKKYYPNSYSLLTVHYRNSIKTRNDSNIKLLINDYCDKVIVLTNKAALSLCEDYSTPRSKVEIIPNCVYDNYSTSFIDKDKIKSLLGIDKNKKILLYVGRFDSNKNPYLLLRAFLNLIKIDSNIHLILVGKGNYDSLFNLIETNWANITLTGFLEPEQLYSFYSIANIGIIPSYYEEFGYVALEMLMFGIPIIANRTGGLEEIIEDGISGRLLDLYIDEKYSEEILKNAIIEILLDDAKQLYYSTNARKRYLENYKIEKFKSKMLDIYNGF